MSPNIAKSIHSSNSGRMSVVVSNSYDRFVTVRINYANGTNTLQALLALYSRMVDPHQRPLDLPLYRKCLLLVDAGSTRRYQSFVLGFFLRKQKDEEMQKAFLLSRFHGDT
jgi:hypothetical protein